VEPTGYDPVPLVLSYSLRLVIFLYKF